MKNFTKILNQLKTHMTNSSHDFEKNVFLVFNTACFGDVLLCNSLCQNIKFAFPNSKIVFIADKLWGDIANYQKDVDEVIIYDKKGIHKGLKGLIKFVKDFPYKKANCAFITYKNERNYLIAKLLQSKKVVVGKTLKNFSKPIKIQYSHVLLLKNISNVQVKNFPIKFNPPTCNLDKFNDIIGNSGKYIALCTLTKNPIKDMPVRMAIDLIQNLTTKTDYKIILTGVGENAIEYAKDLKNAGCNFIDLVNKTSIIELANILKKCDFLISVDTGTMHLGYSLGIKTHCVFLEQGTKEFWAPDEKIYPNVKIYQNPTVEELTRGVYNNEN